jgi:hypothetical protein
MPFGLKMGMSKEQLGTKEQVAPGMYKIARVPRPHPDFESYVAQIGPTTGLCYLKALGKKIATSIYGPALRLEYTKIRDQVASTYGKYSETDILRPGSIWDEPRDWMMGLVKKERMLASQWSSETNATLRPGLREVIVGVSAFSTENGFVWLEYYFDNEPRCEKEINDTSSAVL